MKIQNKKTWAGVCILIAIDQVIKIIINHNLVDKKIPILSPLLYFEPKFNRQYSWINSMLDLGMSKWIHIAIGLITTVLLYLFYQYLNKKLLTNKIINTMYAFVFSGAICSLIDKAFWDGSLDYILIKSLFTFDLKDVYLCIFYVILIILWLLKHKDFKQIEDNTTVKDFMKYILHKSTLQ